MARLALYSIVKALLPINSEIIISAYNVPCVIEYLELANMKLKYIDLKPHTFQMDIDHIIQSISNKTKAIVISHFYGIGVDFSRLLQICRDRNILIIEDCAQAIDSLIKGKNIMTHCGTLGDIGVFSTGILKKITTINGSFIITDNYSLYKKIGLFKNKSKKNQNICNATYLARNLVFNFISRPLIFNVLFFLFKAKVQQANLNIKPKKLIREKINCLFFENNQAFLGVKNFLCFDKRVQGYAEKSIYLSKLFGVYNKNKRYNYLHYPVCVRNRLSIIKKANKQGYDIGAGQFYNFGGNTCPNAGFVVKNNLNIPIYNSISFSDLAVIANEIKKDIIYVAK